MLDNLDNKKKSHEQLQVFCIEQTFGLSTTQFFVIIIRYGEVGRFFRHLSGHLHTLNHYHKCMYRPGKEVLIYGICNVPRILEVFVYADSIPIFG